MIYLIFFNRNCWTIFSILQVWSPMFNAWMNSMMKGSGKNGLRNFTTDRKVWVSGMPADNVSKEINMKLKEMNGDDMTWLGLFFGKVWHFYVSLQFWWRCGWLHFLAILWCVFGKRLRPQKRRSQCQTSDGHGCTTFQVWRGLPLQFSHCLFWINLGHCSMGSWNEMVNNGCKQSTPKTLKIKINF